jgi:carbonic anhydrase
VARNGTRRRHCRLGRLRPIANQASPAAGTRIASCGALAAAAKAEPVPGQISALFQHIRPAVRAARGDVAAAVQENVKIQAQTLVEGSTVISSLVSAGKVAVAGGIFDLRSGRVEPVELPFLKG